MAPLNRDVLRIRLYITPDFKWNDAMHGTSESYYVWVENSETSEIYHHEFFILTRRKLHDEHEMHFTIPLADPLPKQIYVRAVSDRWLGAESVTPVSFQHLRDAVFERFRGGSGIAGANVDLGRGDVGILRHRKSEDRPDPHQHDDDR